MNSQNTQDQSGPPPIAYILAAIGGGVVGRDYAHWMVVDPIIGTGIGISLSLALTKLLNHLYRDPERKVRQACSSIGALGGVALGWYVATENWEGGYSWAIGAVVGGGLGAGLGQVVAAFLSFGAFLLLFLSQGPVGFIVRNYLMSLND